MRARLHILLPFYLTVPDETPFAGHGIEVDGSYTVYFLAPGRSDKPRPHDAPEIELDGKPAFLADVFIIEFHKERFDRRVNSPMDPPKEIIQPVIEWFFKRLRYIIRGPEVHVIDFSKVPWRLTYLADDGSELPDEKGLTRGRGVITLSHQHLPLTPKIWDDLFNLPIEFEPPAWDILLLDARAALPSIGPAIVLAFTALEVFISTVLNQLAARGKVSPTLWEWINDRDSSFLKTPSPEERFDVLLKEFLGASLKEKPELWKAFKSIRQARNKFVHGGKPLVGGAPLSTAEAQALVKQASEIIEFVEVGLPDELKWPKFQHQMELRLRHTIEREQSKPTAENPQSEPSP